MHMFILILPLWFILTNAIGFKILNFIKFVNNLDMKAFLDDNSTLNFDKDNNHIITGNLKIISNNKLSKLFSKRSKITRK